MAHLLARPGGRIALQQSPQDACQAHRCPRAGAAHAPVGNGASYEVDAAALVGRLRGPTAMQLPAVVDVAERVDAAVLGGDVEGRERVRREFGVGR